VRAAPVNLCHPERVSLPRRNCALAGAIGGVHQSKVLRRKAAAQDDNTDIVSKRGRRSDSD
jgi:hypothetical protein